MSTTPVFSEVIDVGFDAKAFETSVAQMVDIWKQGLEQMSGGDMAASTSVDTAGISSAISQITTDLTTLRVSILESFGSLGIAAAEASQRAATSATAAAEEVDEAWKKSSRDQLDEFAKVADGSEEAYAQFLTAADAAIQKGASIGSQTLQTQRMVWDNIREGGVATFDELTARQQQWYVGFASVMAQAENKSREFTQTFVEQQANADVESAADFDKSMQKQVSMYDQALQQMNADFNRRAEERMAIAKRSSEQQAAEQKAASANQGFGARMGAAFSEQMSDLPEMLTNLATMQILWTAIGGVMAAALAIANGISTAFKSGFEYATQLEEAAANLQGVIAANVKLSADMPTNFKMAGDAAKQIAMDFEDAGIKYGIAAEVITRGFKSFIDNGGASLTNNLQESEQVAILFAAALKGAGKDAEATRSMLSEIPKLLDGTATNSSKILETLHLTVPEWNAILAASKQHHDLVQQLTPALAPYIAVAEQAGQRQSTLLDTVKLWGERLMAVVDQSVWDQFKGALQDVKGFFEAHKASLEAIAQTLGNNLGMTVKFGLHLVEWVVQSKAFQGGLVLITGGMQIMVELASLIVQSLITVGDLMSKLGSALSDPSNWLNLSKMWDQIKQAGVQSWKDIETQAKGSVDRIKEYWTNKEPASANPLTTGNKGGTTTTDHTKPNGEAIKDLKTDYDVDAKAITEAQDKIRQQADLDAAARKISIQELAAIKKKATQDEYDQQVQLIATYRELAQVEVQAKQATQKQADGFDNQLSQKGAQLKIANQKAQYTYDLQATKDSVALQDQMWKGIEDATIKGANAELTVLRNAGKNKTMLASEAADQSIAVVKAEHDVLQVTYMQELTAAGANEQAKAAVFAKMAAEEAQYTAAVKTLTADRTAALLREFESGQQPAIAGAKAHAAALQEELQADKRYGESALQTAQRQLQVSQAQLDATKTVIAATQAEIAYADALGITHDALDKKLEDANRAESKAQTAVDVDQQKVTATSPDAAVVDQFGKDFGKTVADWGTFNKQFATDFGNTVQDLGNGITTFQTSVNGIIAAIDKGGILGGAGAASSTAGGILQSGLFGKDGLVSKFTSAFSSAPVIGGLLSAAGTLFTSIAGLFTAKAQEIANQIQKEFQNTVKAYQDGSATITQTIAAVEKERADAIAQLSGKKGGQDQLNKLLPQLDQEIQQLKQQQQQIVTAFETSLQDLELHSTVLAKVNDQWAQINKQVKDYLDAGGDANKAAKFLSDNLAQIKQDAYNQLESGEQNAINDAMQLNTLLQQKIDLQKKQTDLVQQEVDLKKQEAATEFSILNADALERRGSLAIQTGTQLQQQRQQYQTQLDGLEQQKQQNQTQLDSLNLQIDLTQHKVDMEKQIFNIAQDTATLQKESNQIVLDQLAQQLKDLKDYQTVYNDITLGGNGYQMNPSMLSGTDASTSIGQITINMPPGTSPTDGRTLGDTLTKTLQQRGRYGMNPVVTKRSSA